MTSAGTPPYPVTLVLLAGGASRRMKRDKALLPAPVEPLIRRVLAGIEGLFEETIVSVSPGQSFDFIDARQIADEREGQGPLAGILAGLKAARFETIFVLACDIPVLDPDFAKAMIAASDGFDASVPRTDKGLEPLIAVYKRRIVPLVERLLGEGKRSVLDLYPLCGTRFVSVGSPPWLLNLNTPEDYERYLRTLERP
jgi:molybdenum cofactor guanylyltransferase